MGQTEFLLLVAVGGGIIAVLFATFRGAAREGDSQEQVERPAGDTPAASAERAELEDRRLAVLSSLEEIESDLEAGNLSEADYEGLRRRYEGEAAHLARQLSESTAQSVEARPAGAAAAAPARSWLPAAIGWTAGGVAFVALAWLVMSTALRPRGANDSITGSLPGQEMGSGAGVAVAEVDAERLAALEQIVVDEPNNVEALNELGHMYLRLQRNDELNAVTMRALELDPESPEALTHMGMLLFSMNHPEGVIPSFDSALEVDPDFGEALQFKGMVSFMRQDFVTAVEAWEHYLEVVPAAEVSPRIRGMLEAARASVASGDTP
jgi:cytochrome c-type biogenesis protein CcmH/NrfG